MNITIHNAKYCPTHYTYKDVAIGEMFKSQAMPNSIFIKTLNIKKNVAAFDITSGTEILFSNEEAVDIYQHKIDFYEEYFKQIKS